MKFGLLVVGRSDRQFVSLGSKINYTTCSVSHLGEERKWRRCLTILYMRSRAQCIA